MNEEEENASIPDIIRSAEEANRAELIILKGVFSKYFIIWGLLFCLFSLLDLSYLIPRLEENTFLLIIHNLAYILLIIIGGVKTSRYFRTFSMVTRFKQAAFGTNFRRVAFFYSFIFYVFIVALLLFFTLYGLFYKKSIIWIYLALDIYYALLSTISIYLIIVLKISFGKVPIQGYASSIAFILGIAISWILEVIIVNNFQVVTNLITIIWTFVGISWIVSGLTFSTRGDSSE